MNFVGVIQGGRCVSALGMWDDDGRWKLGRGGSERRKRRDIVLITFLVRQGLPESRIADPHLE